MKKKLALCAMFLLATGALVSTKISAMEPFTPDTRIIPNFNTINTNNNTINTNNTALEKAKIQFMPEEICNINKFIENIKIDAKHIHNKFISDITYFENSFKDKDRCDYISHITISYPKVYKAIVGGLQRKLNALDYKIDKKDYDNYKNTFEKIFDSIDNFRKNLKIPTEQPNFINDIIKISNMICEKINAIPKITISKIPETQQAAPIFFSQLEESLDQKSLDPFHDLEDLIKNTKKILNSSFNNFVKKQPNVRLLGVVNEANLCFDKLNDLVNSSEYMFNSSNYNKLKNALKTTKDIIKEYKNLSKICYDDNNNKTPINEMKDAFTKNKIADTFIEKFITQLNKILEIINISKNISKSEMAPTALSQSTSVFNELFEKTKELMNQFIQNKINLDNIKGKISSCEKDLNEIKSKFKDNNDINKNLISILNERIKPILDGMKEYLNNEENYTKLISKNNWDVWISHKNFDKVKSKIELYSNHFNVGRSILTVLNYLENKNF